MPFSNVQRKEKEVVDEDDIVPCILVRDPPIIPTHGKMEITLDKELEN